LTQKLYNFAYHLTLILLLHYLVKCRSHIVFTTMNSDWVAHASAQKITQTTKSVILFTIIFALRSYVDELK